MYTFSPSTKIESAKVNANFAGLADGTLDDDNNSLELYRNEGLYDFVASGCVWTGDAYGSTRVASMTAGVVYINGIRVVVAAVSSRTFTASKDTYIYVDSTGALTYSEVSNNAASPAFPTNSILLAIVVTGASTIASALSINQGRIGHTTANIYLPTSMASTPSAGVITDSNGYRVYPTDPAGKLVASNSRLALSTTGSPGGSSVSWNGMNYLVFQAEANKNYRLYMLEGALSGMTNNDNLIWPCYLGTSANAYTTSIGEFGSGRISSINNGEDHHLDFNSGTYSGKTFLSIKFRNAGFSGTMNINTDTTRTGVYTIERLN
jgi:hypothetical protein